MTLDHERLRQRIQELERIETEYLQVRQLLKEAAANQSLEQYGDDCILHTNPETGGILFANPLATTLLGYSQAELLTLKISALEVYPAKKGTNPLRYVETSIEKQVYECWYRQADGRLTPMRVHKRLLVENEVTIAHYSLEDLSLRRALWSELTRREDPNFHFREKLKVLNEINATLAILPTFDEICYHAVRLGMDGLGFDRLSIWFREGKTYRMVGAFGTNEHGQIRDERGSSWSFENTHLEDFVKGQQTPVITQDHAPIYNERSEIIGYGWHISVPLRYRGEFIGFMTADNYLSQQPMKDYQPELLRVYGSTIGHFTAHQRDRETAQRLADDIRLKQARVKMLETFINHVGHDFRTPLTVINTNTYLLSKTQDVARRAEIAEAVQNQVMYINRVIKQMLEVVKLEGGFEFQRLPIDLTILVNRMSYPIQAQAEKKGLGFSLETSRTLMMSVDTEWIERALREIMNNAVQYTEAGGRVNVKMSITEDAVNIAVQDTGIGIGAVDLDKIFTHLYRVDRARTERGVGLGLTIAKLVIEAHGGQIQVQSALGQGSTFEIILPR